MPCYGYVLVVIKKATKRLDALRTYMYLHDVMFCYTIVSINVGGLYTIISPLRDKWKDIGLQLGLFLTTLEAIDKSYDGRTDRCLYSVLTKWLHRRDDVRKKGGVTWNVLIQALKSVGADETVLATYRAEAINPDQTSNIIITL